MSNIELCLCVLRGEVRSRDLCFSPRHHRKVSAATSSIRTTDDRNDTDKTTKWKTSQICLKFCLFNSRNLQSVTVILGFNNSENVQPFIVAYRHEMYCGWWMHRLNRNETEKRTKNVRKKLHRSSSPIHQELYAGIAHTSASRFGYFGRTNERSTE